MIRNHLLVAFSVLKSSLVQTPFLLTDLLDLEMLEEIEVVDVSIRMIVWTSMNVVVLSRSRF